MDNRYEAVLFDKDGTLIDFAATWDVALGAALEASSRDGMFLAACDAIGYDPSKRVVLSASPFVAEPQDVVVDLLSDHVDIAVFDEVLMSASLRSVKAMPDLADTLEALRARGIRLAVATNDSEELAHKQLSALDVAHYFELIVGYDSGSGAKPEPGMLLRAASALSVRPERCLMVGDSEHDLTAARRAGMDSALIGAIDSSATQPTWTISRLSEIVHLSMGREDVAGFTPST